MTLSKSSRIVRWAYWMEKGTDFKIPTQTSLCNIFWRCVLLTPVAGFFIGVVGVLVSPVWIPLWFIERVYGKGTLMQLVVAAKGRVCPIVRIEREAA